MPPTFAQPARRNLTTPIVSALLVLGIAIGLLIYFAPPSTASVTLKDTAVYPAHIVFKSESLVVGSDRVEDEVYVVVNLHIDDRLRFPLFFKDFTATLIPSNPDGSPGEPITTSAIEKPEVPNLYTTFPALKSLADQQDTPLLVRDTQIDPGKSGAGIVLLHFPVDQATWDNRKSATLTIDLYHQPSATIEIPKTTLVKPATGD